MSDIKISKIQIDLPKGKSVTLTVQEARELKRQLEELFGVLGRRQSERPQPTCIPWQRQWTICIPASTQTPPPKKGIWCSQSWGSLTAHLTAGQQQNP